MNDRETAVYGLIRAHQNYYDCMNECGAGLPLIEEATVQDREMAHARHVATVICGFIDGESL